MAAPTRSTWGALPGGTILHITTSGNGDLVDSRYQANPDGSLFAPATGVYSFANPGAAYPVVNGGDGINHFADGGATYDATGSGYPFAGPTTPDTTAPGTMRFGAVVGTFSSSPARADWFFIGFDDTVTIPAGGAHVFLAVNDTNNSDNHGAYAGTDAIVTPEPASIALLGIGMASLLRRRSPQRSA